VNDVNTLFDVPHSRFNDVSREQFEAAGLKVLVEGPQAGVHLAVSGDLFRVVLFQGHPEYDTISLLKEYKREVTRFAAASAATTRPSSRTTSACRCRASSPSTGSGCSRAGAGHSGAGAAGAPGRADPAQHLARTPRGGREQLDRQGLPAHNRDRKLPFMDGIDPEDPLGLRGPSDWRVLGGAVADLRGP